MQPIVQENVHQFPGNKRFAFTVFDDTDKSTLGNVGDVYRLLHELGLRTTKSVWALPNVPGARIDGSTLQDREYLAWVLQLQEQGFEIAWHNARNSDSPTGVTEQGLRNFERLIGRMPRSHANHSDLRENIHWGPQRFESKLRRLLYHCATRFQHWDHFEGSVCNSRHFWGNLCREHIDYVRNFVFDEINLDRVSPRMPYHDPLRPYVKYWFTSSEGNTVDAFCKMLSEPNQDRLEEEGGVCIIYTHFACGFQTAHGLHPRFESLMRRLAKKDGWFVPVATLLDHLRAERGDIVLTARDRNALESRWLWHKLRHGAS